MPAVLSLIKRKASAVWTFYYDGFRNMTVGKTLWVVILIKLFIFFGVLRLFFFPDVLKRDYATDEARAQHVRTVLAGSAGEAEKDNLKINNTDTDE